MTSEPGNAKTDEELAALASMQREFFGMLIERYDKKLTRYLHRLGVRDGEDVHDLLQEIFIKVYRNLNEFDTSLKFSSWIYRIAHNETMSWYRKRAVRPEGHLAEDGEEILALLTDDSSDSALSFDAGLDVAALADAIEKLHVEYREIIVLRYFEHKDYNEISDILKIPVGSVGTRIHRAKKQLTELLPVTHT